MIRHPHINISMLKQGSYHMILQHFKIVERGQKWIWPISFLSVLYLYLILQKNSNKKVHCEDDLNKFSNVWKSIYSRWSGSRRNRAQTCFSPGIRPRPTHLYWKRYFLRSCINKRETRTNIFCGQNRNKTFFWPGSKTTGAAHV
jgi:hypothetical protein